MARVDLPKNKCSGEASKLWLRALLLPARLRQLPGTRDYGFHEGSGRGSWANWVGLWVGSWAEPLQPLPATTAHHEVNHYLTG